MNEFSIETGTGIPTIYEMAQNISIILYYVFIQSSILSIDDYTIKILTSPEKHKRCSTSRKIKY